jgi:hypothetical protein
MEGIAISGWILAMAITAYTVLLIGVLALLALFVLLIRKFVKK